LKGEDMTVNEQIAKYIHDPDTRVYIKHNNELNYYEWVYAVVVENSNNFWLDAFETEDEANEFIESNNLILTK
jgi:hypothetical protein